MNKLLDSLEMIKSSELFEVRRQAEENNLSDNVFLKYIEEYTDEIKSSSERIVSNGIDRLIDELCFTVFSKKDSDFKRALKNEITKICRNNVPQTIEYIKKTAKKLATKVYERYKDSCKKQSRDEEEKEKEDSKEIDTKKAKTLEHFQIFKKIYR